MATTYRTPGVYVEEIPKFPPSVAAVDTAIPAFIGYTQQGEADKPTRIESLVEFERIFGTAPQETAFTAVVDEVTAADPDKREPGVTVSSVDFDQSKRSPHILYYALQLFYANGGKSAYIVSAGQITAAAPVLADLQGALDAVATVDEPTLLVVPEASSLSNADYRTLLDAALLQCKDLGDRFVITDAHEDGDAFADTEATGTALNTAIDTFRNASVGLNNLKYGAAYAPHLETVLDFRYDEATVEVAYTRDGKVQEMANGALQDAADPNAPGAKPKLSELKDISNAAYEAIRARIRDEPLILPPSAAVAGVYAQVDNDRGVWKAPANVSLAAVVRPTVEFSQAALEKLNVDPTAGKSINAIRAFTGKGTLVWGARTLAGNDNEWRYVNVRRFFIFAEESIKKATEPFVFEPNDANTWVKVQAMVENFLTTQWRAGALQGVKPEHAFYVAVGLGRTMTALDILEGRMIVEIGLAVVRPAEFIILRFSHKMAES